MCVNMLLHADDINPRELEELAGLQQSVAVDGGLFVPVTPQHLDMQKIEREIKLVLVLRTTVYIIHCSKSSLKVTPWFFGF